MFTPLDIHNSPNCLPFPWHPSVIFIAEGWNGHTYWMAQTPFPPMEIAPYRDRYELPCIYYSDDGIHWKPINGNPIVDLSKEEIDAHNYYSDPHLVLKDGILELYFRYTILTNRQLVGNKTILLRSESTNGFVWSSPQVIADLRTEQDVNIWGEQIISPALRWDGNKYQCWYVDKSSYLHDRHVRLTTSIDGKQWNQNILCSLEDRIIDPWHIDVQYYDGKYQMIVYDMNKLVWYESEDGVHFNYVSDILSPSPKRYDFYTDGLYRACSVKTNERIRVYFSAKRKDKTYIGLLATEDRIHFKPIHGLSQWSWFSVVWKPVLKSIFKRNFKS